MEITDLLQWIIVLLMAFVFYAFMMSRDFWTFRRMGIPGPTPLPIVGNLMALVWKGFREFDISTIIMYGKVFGHFDMLSANLVVADKEILKEILVKQFNNFIDKRTFDGYNGDLEHGLTVNRGEHWKRNRSIVTPAFSSSKLRKMVPLIQEACDTLVKTLPHSIRAGDHGQVELTRLFRACTMDMISSTAFGIRVDSQGNPNDPFVMNAKKMFDFSLTGPKMLLMLFCPALKPLLLKLGVCIFPHDSMAYFRKLTAQLLDERRRSKNMCREDFLQLMVDAREGRLGKDGEDEDCTAKNILLNEHHQSLTFEEILGNVELFYVAGYETTAITLTMLSYNLATHPECQERLRQEIEEEIGSEPIGIDNLNKLQYLEMCINETLRMYSPFMRFDRKCVRTTKVKDMTIPAGMVVSVPINAIHHDAEIWEKPDVFNPERFSASERAKHDPMDFLPFGHGPRGCIGTRLAYIELKMAMVAVIQNFRLLVGSKTDIPPNMVENAVLMPSSVWLKLEAIV